MRFTYAPIVDQHARDAVFERMEAEGLTFEACLADADAHCASPPAGSSPFLRS